jgi:hypothetical protein
MTDPAQRLPSMIPQLANWWALAISEDPAEIAALEARTGRTQAAVVDHFIEESDWQEDLPHLTGGGGAPAERRAALRVAWEKQEGQAP